MKLKSPFFIITALAFLSLFFLNSWQGFRYQELKRDVEELEAEQQEWLEKNKKAIAALAVLSSPERVKNLAENELGLRPIESSDILKVVIKARGDE
jgi:cell division protein FtsL